MRFGGPYLGLLAREEISSWQNAGPPRRPNYGPNGKRCWVLTLQTREQHIRREKATSNICTNQGLFALRAAVYLAALGPEGLKETAELCLRKAHYAAERLARMPAYGCASSDRSSRNSLCRCQATCCGAGQCPQGRLSWRAASGTLVSVAE